MVMSALIFGLIGIREMLNRGAHFRQIGHWAWGRLLLIPYKRIKDTIFCFEGQELQCNISIKFIERTPSLMFLFSCCTS